MIDAHVHVFAKASDRYPRLTNDVMPADREEPVEKLLQQMDASGVAKANLVQTGGTTFEQHAYLIHCLATYPDRFRGIALLDDSESPAEQMDRLTGQAEGIIGFRLFRIGGEPNPLKPMDPRSFDTYPLWELAAEKDYVIWLYPRAAENHCVPFLMDAFPEVTVVFNHMAFCPGDGSSTRDDKGRPHIELPVPPVTRYNTMGLYQYPNVCVALSGQYAFSRQEPPYEDLASWHSTLLRKFGADRLMWGTDAPWIYEDPGYARLTTVIDDLLPELSDEERAAICGGTAETRLFTR